MTAQLEGIHWASWQKEREESKQAWQDNVFEPSDASIGNNADEWFDEGSDSYHY